MLDLIKSNFAIISCDFTSRQNFKIFRSFYWIINITMCDNIPYVAPFGKIGIKIKNICN